MISTHPSDRGARARPLATRALVVAAAIVLARALLFILRPHVGFDSDQAVMGLMAKHLAEGRAFPMYLYGQSYILAVQAWLAAPLFLIAGVSIAALKLPLLAMNVLLGVLLVRSLMRNGVQPAAAVVASLFFLLPPPGTAAAFMEAGGGNVEPLLYIVLLWILRRRPGWFGLVLAVGTLQREFTVYALPALALVWATTGEFRVRNSLRLVPRGLRVAFELFLVAQWLHRFASAAGPGTSIADLTTPSSGLADVAQRFCVDPGTFVYGVSRLATSHWPTLFGTAPIKLADLGLATRYGQGMPGLTLLFGATMALIATRVAVHVRLDRTWWKRCEFFVYLTAAGVISPLVYAIGRCGNISVATMRYDLMSVLGAVGMAGWFMAVEERRTVKRLAMAGILVWAVLVSVPHAKLWAEHGRGTPTDKERIIQRLEDRGIRYVIANYWLAYYIDFVTRERIVASAEDYSRIREYDRLVEAHRAEAIRIRREPCEGGYAVMPDVYFCPP